MLKCVRYYFFFCFNNFDNNCFLNTSVTAKNTLHPLWQQLVPLEQKPDQNLLTQKFKFCKDLSIKSVGMEGFLRAN